MPLFSIIIPTYNIAPYIARCLESCINQTFSNIEILVIDDCGSDKSISIAQDFAQRDSRIRIIKNPQNLGLFRARIAGEREAKGEYILPLDGDDYISSFTCKILYRHILQHTAILHTLKLIKNTYRNIIGGGGGDMNSPKISIIIPTFNVRSYISRCLESCINQTLREIEIIIMDDCGSDGASEIAKAYERLDSRICIYQNEKNLGTFASRIEGVKRARGEYILFLDADDYLDLKACESAYNKAYESSLQDIAQISESSALDSEKDISKDDLPDIIHFKSHFPISTQASFMANLTHLLRYILPTRLSKAPLYNEEILHNFFLKSKHFPKFTLWDKCYKASLLKEANAALTHINRPLTMAEDMLKFFVVSSLAQSYVSLNHRLHYYCLNSHSATQDRAKAAKRIDDLVYIAHFIHTIAPIHSTAARARNEMINRLTSLIILESRFDSAKSLNFSESSYLDNEGGAEQNAQPNQIGQNQIEQNQTQFQNLTQQTPYQDILISFPQLTPLKSLIDQGLITPPSPPFWLRPIRSHYLRSCVLSLQFWNRSLTYIRLFAYILSFGKVKL